MSFTSDTSSPGAGEVLLSLDGIRHTVTHQGDDLEILHGISLEARAGEVTVLLGPNGAGKTTTLNIAQGLEAPTSGRVSLLGQAPFRAGAGLRSQVGVMLQDGGLPPSQTPLRLLEHLQKMYEHPANIYGLIERLDITEFQDRTIRRLSGGQKQRVALAASLVGRPRVVFLDEPSTGLDPVSRQVVFHLIKELKAAGLAIVLTTHLLGDAEKLADHVILLRQGEVIRSGTVDELTSHDGPAPWEFTVREEISEHMCADLPSNLKISPYESPRQDTSAEERKIWRVYGVAGPDELVQLAQWFQRHDLMPQNLLMARRSLEDVFWELTP